LTALALHCVFPPPKGPRLVQNMATPPILDNKHRAALDTFARTDVGAHPEGTTAPCSYLVHYPGPVGT